MFLFAQSILNIYAKHVITSGNMYDGGVKLAVFVRNKSKMTKFSKEIIISKTICEYGEHFS